jgi:deoxycytidylate deaminase
VKEAWTDPAASPPSNTELVVGLVGALGTDLDRVAHTISSRLQTVFAYQTEIVSVSSLMRDLAWDRDLCPSHEDERVLVNMDAGRDLNRAWAGLFGDRNDALARLAILRIRAIREGINRQRGHAMLDAPLHRFAYILRSFKRPDEVALLRAVYGDRFVLFGALAPRDRRRRRLYDRCWKSYDNEDELAWHNRDELRLDALMRRDEREHGEAGQDVRDTFHRADFFVDDHEAVLGDQVERCLRVLFGDPFVTPTKDEAGMAHATTAARRSAEPGRQVGAAIATERGDILAVGTNEVPRAFGGQYWPDDEDIVAAPSRDGREFRNDIDTNNDQQQQIAAEVTDVVKRQIEVVEHDVRERLDAVDADQRAATEEALSQAFERLAREVGGPALLSTRLGDITEYGRAVHAEMSAITSAARLGIRIEGSVLYTTTFPCHNCARHVIASGIRRLVYIAPYAKSQAYRLHDDSLVVAPEATETLPTDKVVFQPLIGVAPRRFAFLFDAPPRKEDDGRILRPRMEEAVPRMRDVEHPALGLDQLAYHVRETAVATRTLNVLRALAPREEDP